MTTLPVSLSQRFTKWSTSRKRPALATASKDLLKSIRDKAHEVKFWDFQIQYPQGRKVADLPSTVTMIRAGDMEKIVVNTHQAPAELEAFEDYLEGIINGLAWKPMAGK
jgi:hypothetical protein